MNSPIRSATDNGSSIPEIASTPTFTRRRLNLPLLAGLILVVAAGAAAVYYTHRAQSRRTATALLRKSVEAEDGKDRARALKYLELYLTYRPDDLTEQGRFAILHAEVATTVRAKLGAYFLLERALTQAPERDDIRRRLAKLALELSTREPGRLGDAVEHLNVLLKAHPDDAELMEQLARCFEAGRKYTEAAEWYGKAVERDQGREAAYVRLAQLLRTQLDKPDRADEVMNKLVAVSPNSASAWLARCRYRERFSQPGAENDLAKAAQLAPEDLEVLVATADRAQRQGDFEGARRGFQRGVERFPTAARLRLALAAVEAQTGNLDAAEKCLEAGIIAAPHDDAIRLALIETRIRKGALGKARADIASLRGRGVARERLELLEATISMTQKQWQAAVDKLEHLLPGIAENPTMSAAVNLALGQCYGQLGDPDREFVARLRATELAGDSPQSWFDLVRQLTVANQITKAEEVTQRAARLLTGPSATVTLARCYAVIGLTERASQYYKSAIAAQPGEAAILRRAAEYALSLDEPQAALVMLNRIAGSTSRSREDLEWGQRTMIAVLAQCGDYRALAELRRQLEIQPGPGENGEPASTQRAEALKLAATRGRDNRRKAIQLMEALVKRPSPDAEDRFLLARLCEDDRDWPKALDQLRLILSEGHGQPFFLGHYVRALLRRGHVEEAALALERLRQTEPRSYRTMTLRTHLLKSQGKGNEAVALIRDYLTRDENQSPRLSGLLEEIGETNAAEAILRQYASSSRQGQSRLALARFLARHGRVDEALDCCEAASSSCSPEEIAASMIVVVDSAQPESKPLLRVEQWLLNALRVDEHSMALNFTIASLRKIQGRAQEAESLYRKLVERGDPTGLALNNLAYLLANRESHREEAAALIDRAIATHSRQPGLLDTRSRVSLNAGKAQSAIDDLEEAVSKLPTSTRLFRLAEAYHVAKDEASAREVLREAQTFGLKEASLSPPERAVYRQLVAGLGTSEAAAR